MKTITLEQLKYIMKYSLYYYLPYGDIVMKLSKITKEIYDNRKVFPDAKQIGETDKEISSFVLKTLDETDIKFEIYQDNKLSRQAVEIF